MSPRRVNIYADLSAAKAATIEQLRLALLLHSTWCQGDCGVCGPFRP